MVVLRFARLRSRSTISTGADAEGRNDPVTVKSQLHYERQIHNHEESAQRTASPLIPAFSPLRGEGVALGAPAKLNVLLRAGRQSAFVRFRLHVFVEHFSSRRDRIYSRYRRAAWCPNFSKTRCAPPSPLNGERAGVRGEAVRLAHGTCEGSHEYFILTDAKHVRARRWWGVACSFRC
jgi:hypothetical protein